MKKVLITGAAGFLGSHLCDRFIKEGFHVIGMDNLITGNMDNIQHLFALKQFEFYHHDVSKFVHVPGDLDLETRIVRIFNTYGPRMRINDGRALPAFLSQAINGEPLTVFGDGSQTRSFCYVDDLVEGIYRLLMSDYHLPVNIGNPDEITIGEFAEEIIGLVEDKNLKVIYKPLPKDDPKRRRPDTTKAKEILGWEAQVDRREGLRRTYEYFRSVLQPMEA